MSGTEQNLIIYNSKDGKASVALFARDGNVWMNQSQLAELFATSLPNINMHISNILKDKELSKDSVIQNYLTTASDGKQYDVKFYAIDMVLAIGFRVKSPRGTEFRRVRAAHEANDEMLERIYIGRLFKNDTERLEKLFALYTQDHKN